MRTVVDLPEDEVEAIKARASQEAISEGEAIRRAIRAYLETAPASEAEARAFGIRAGGEEGVAYQERLRGEWCRRA